MDRFRVSHRYMGIASIICKLLHTHPQILTNIMGRFRVSLSCRGVVSILCRLFYTHLQILTYIMGRFRVTSPTLIEASITKN